MSPRCPSICNFSQGELTDTVKTLDLGVQAAQSELDLAAETAARLVALKLVCKPDAQAAAPAKPMGSLKNSAIMQRLQASRAQSNEPKDNTASASLEAK